MGGRCWSNTASLDILHLRLESLHHCGQVCHLRGKLAQNPGLRVHRGKVGEEFVLADLFVPTVDFAAHVCIVSVAVCCSI